MEEQRRIVWNRINQIGTEIDRLRRGIDEDKRRLMTRLIFVGTEEPPTMERADSRREYHQMISESLRPKKERLEHLEIQSDRLYELVWSMRTRYPGTQQSCLALRDPLLTDCTAAP
jgi:hypothetical protein